MIYNKELESKIDEYFNKITPEELYRTLKDGYNVEMEDVDPYFDHVEYLSESFDNNFYEFFTLSLDDIFNSPMSELAGERTQYEEPVVNDAEQINLSEAA